MIRTFLLPAVFVLLELPTSGQVQDQLNSYTLHDQTADQPGSVIVPVQTADQPGSNTLPQTVDQAAADTSNRSSIRFVGFPVLGYSPETRIMGGVYTQLIAGNPQHTRPSSLGLSMLVSQNRQYSFNLFPEIWWNKNQFRLAGELKWQHWPDKFYGIGNDTHKEDEEYYISRIGGVKLDLMKSVYKQLYSGSPS